MRFRRGSWQWYDVIFLLLAFVIVWPDMVLDWISERTGKAYGFWHIVLVEVLAVGLIVVALALLMPVYPRLQWWFPLVPVGFLALFRLILWIMLQFLGTSDW